MTILYIEDNAEEKGYAEMLGSAYGEPVHCLNQKNLKLHPRDNEITILGHSGADAHSNKPTLGNESPEQIADKLHSIYGDNHSNELHEIFIIGCESGMKTSGSWYGKHDSFAEKFKHALQKKGFHNTKIYSVAAPKEAGAVRIQVEKPHLKPVEVSAYYYEQEETKRVLKLESDLDDIKAKKTKGTGKNAIQQEIKSLQKPIMSDTEYHSNYKMMFRDKGQKFDTWENKPEDMQRPQPENDRFITESEKSRIRDLLADTRNVMSEKSQDPKNIYDPKYKNPKYKKEIDDLTTFIGKPDITINQLNDKLTYLDLKYSDAKILRGLRKLGGTISLKSNVSDPIRSIINTAPAPTPNTVKSTTSSFKKRSAAVVKRVYFSVPTSSEPEPTLTEVQLKDVKKYYQFAVDQNENGRKTHQIKVSGENYNLTQQYKALQGDRLKTQILADVQKDIASIMKSENRETELKAYIKEFKHSDKYKILKTSQGYVTKYMDMAYGLFKSSFRTDSLVALDKIFKDNLNLAEIEKNSTPKSSPHGPGRGR